VAALANIACELRVNRINKTMLLFIIFLMR
jgi:hypothetical protein